MLRLLSGEKVDGFYIDPARNIPSYGDNSDDQNDGNMLSNIPVCRPHIHNGKCKDHGAGSCLYAAIDAQIAYKEYLSRLIRPFF
jgi:hypothetical protein